MSRKTAKPQRIDKIIKVELAEIIRRDLEEFLDLLGELVGDPLITEISYDIVGHTKTELRLRVTGFAGDEDEA